MLVSYRAGKPREKWVTQAMNYAGKQNAKNPTILPSSSLLRRRSGRSHAGAGSLRDSGTERLRTSSATQPFLVSSRNARTTLKTTV